MVRIYPFLLLCGVIAVLVLSVRVAVAAESLAAVYRNWTNGPPADPDFFPIGVWLQEPGLAGRYKAAGINVYMGLPRDPSEGDLAILRHYGMRVILRQNDAWMRYKDEPLVIGWLQKDEPDNSQREDGTYIGPVPPRTVIENYERFRRNDPTRPIFLNLGQGVANDEWVGRGPNASLSDYLDYVKGGDVISFDIYPVTSIRKPDGENYLWYVGKGLDRLTEWTGGAKILWNILGTTRIHSERKVTPHWLRAQVWMSIIKGSRGIVYFVHEWYPRFNAAALLADAEMLAAVTEINHQIHSLARVLNSPSVAGLVSVESHDAGIPIAYMVKKDDTFVYVFAVGMRNAPVNATITIHNAAADTTVEVVGEERTITATGGRFVESFGPYDVRIFRIKAMSS